MNNEKLTKEEFKNKVKNNTAGINYVKHVCKRFLDAPLRSVFRPPLCYNDEFVDVFVSVMNGYKEYYSDGQKEELTLTGSSPFKSIFGDTKGFTDVETSKCLEIIGDTPNKLMSRKIAKNASTNQSQTDDTSISKKDNLEVKKKRAKKYEEYKNIYFESVLPFLELNAIDYFDYLSSIDKGFIRLSDIHIKPINADYIKKSGKPATIADLLYGNPDEEGNCSISDELIIKAARRMIMGYDLMLTAATLSITSAEAIKEAEKYFTTQLILIVGLRTVMEHSK